MSGTGLSRPEIMRVVNRYIGVSSGYLGDFSYGSHAAFYPEYCDLDINPNDIEGTTRERFIQILSAASAWQQARILKGVVERFPVSGPAAPITRTAELRDELLALAERVDRQASVGTPSLERQTEILRHALDDAESLLRDRGPASAVDRLHTALHAYLLSLCRDLAVPYPDEASVAKLFKVLRQHLPQLAATGPRAGDIQKIHGAVSTILDVMSPIRNRSSLAHPTEHLLSPAEAMLVINVARSLLRYLDDKLR